MAGLKVMFGFLLLALVYAALAAGAEPETTTGSGPNIPKQCIDNSVTPVSCAGTEDSEDGLLVHPDDCELFYYCVEPHSPPICRQCPAKLHFNPTKKVCDLPENAGCQAGKKN